MFNCIQKNNLKEVMFARPDDQSDGDMYYCTASSLWERRKGGEATSTDMEYSSKVLLIRGR